MQAPDRLPPPTAPRRLMRSTRDRMWAGVAGGMADYFDIDPALVRLIWVAAAVVSGGLAVPVYILAWIILPRDDRPASGPEPWRDWSREFHSETQRLADEARRMASEVRGQSWQGPVAEPGPTVAPTSTATTTEATHPVEADLTAEPPLTPAPRAATDKGDPASYTPEPTPAWSTLSYTAPPQPPARQRRSTGAILVLLGIVLLAANAGWFRWIDWHVFWPLIVIGIGVALLAKQANWRR